MSDVVGDALAKIGADERRLDQLDAWVVGHAGAVGFAEDFAAMVLPSLSSAADLGLTLEGAALTMEIGPLSGPIVGIERALKNLVVAKLQARLDELTRPPPPAP